MTIDGEEVSYWTQFGAYHLNASMPGYVSLVATDATKVVESSYFTVETDRGELVPAEGKVFVATESVLDLSYVLTDGVTSDVAGQMDMLYEFEGSRPVKITATLDCISPIYRTWSVVWIIAPNKEAVLRDGTTNPVGLDVYSGQRIASPEFNVRLGAGKAVLEVNWSDAKAGDLDVVSRAVHESDMTALRVTFPAGMRSIDPTFVANPSTGEATEFGSQRKVFWYNGNYWLFYFSGSGIVYSTSPDGSTWGPAYPLPQGTCPCSGTGFDVSSRNGVVGVGWIDTSYYIYFKGGTIQGDKIVWKSRVQICPFIQDIEMTWAWPITITVGTDSSFWINYLYETRWWDEEYYRWRLDEYHLVQRSFDGLTFYNEALWKNDYVASPNYYVLMPGSNGNMSLLHTLGSSSSVDYTYCTGITNWSAAITKDLGMSTTSKANNFSAASSMNGALHVAYLGTNGYVRYAELYPNGTMIGPTNVATGVASPSIAIDANGVLHLAYVSSPGQRAVYYTQRGEFGGSWSTPICIYTAASGVTVKGLTCSYNPANVLSIAWTEVNGGTKTVKFASIPLPFGTPGAPSNPWNRDGLSPYGTYFQMNSDYVSPGSGLMTLSQTDVAIEGRAGMLLGLSRIYQQPRYFWSNGTAYGTKSFPFCNIGEYWSLDLPWMDDVCVCLANGQRYIIQWGNQGNSKEFVCHADAQFVLRDVTMGGSRFYELLTASGQRYKFESSSPHKLLMVSDLDNYNPKASGETVPYNCLNFTYSSDRLSAITESGTALGRSVSFAYDGGGRLAQVTRPDGKKVNYTYASHTIASATKYFLRTVTDPDGRVTTFYYNNTASYILGGVLYPTGGCTNLSFAQDLTPCTEMSTWMVTKESLRNGTLVSNPLIRQTNFDYKIINGRVVFAKVSTYNETGALQGWNEYIFRSSLASSRETIKSSSGTQLQAKVTWYSLAGQPARIDTYLGTSPTVNSTEYMNYDDWGNQIYTRDALGHESFYTYANTSNQNSFQGGEALDRTTSGKILDDAFDDWDYSDWQRNIGSGCSSTLDGTVDPAISPALKLNRTSGTLSCNVQYTIPDQSGSFIIQTVFKVDRTGARGMIQARSASYCRVDIIAYNGYFQYVNSAGQYVNAAPCLANTWYDVGIRVNSNSTYDIFIDGAVVKNGAPLRQSGAIKYFVIKASDDGTGSPMSVWFDNVRIYKSLTITLSGIPSGCVVDLVASNGALLDRSVGSNILVMSRPPLASPPAFMRVYFRGNYSFSMPMLDVWGGDAYSYSRGFHKSNLPKTILGYNGWNSVVGDDGEPWGSTPVYSYYYPGTVDLNWAWDPDNAVSSNQYHYNCYLSSYWTDYSSHYHGYINDNPGWAISPTDTIIQFVQLTNGRLPYEMALQFYLAQDNRWHRVYWGGTTDLISTAPYYQVASVRCGPMPTLTGQWLMLTVKASDIGVTTNTYLTGTLYALYSGTAMWDATSKATRTGIEIVGLTSGMKVLMKLDDGTAIQGTATSSSLTLTPYTSSIRAFPIAATFEIQDNSGKTLYVSPRVPEVYNGDQFTYSSPSFYPNSIKFGIHNRPVGSFTYQDYAKSVSQETYLSYDIEGSQIETRSKLATGWTYTRSGYDKYGNLVWSMDGTGRMTYTDYSSSNKYTYPISMRIAEKQENLDWDNSWTAGATSWITNQYSSTQWHSQSRSIQQSFSWTSGTDYGTVLYYKDFYASRVTRLSVWMYSDMYRHNGDGTDSLDSGIRMRLYDSAGVNYANYTYWLACWYQGGNNRTTADPTVKVICGMPTQSTWIQRTLYPGSDWTINWERCDKVRFELYTTCVAAWGPPGLGDQFRVYYDDFRYSDQLYYLGGELPKTSYSYDLSNGRVLSSTDPLGHTTSTQYDVLGRVVRRNNSDGTYSTYAYDDASNKVTATDELGQKVMTRYDSIGREFKIQRLGAGTTVYSTSTVYNTWQDKPSRTVDEMGRVTKCTYDYKGRTTSVRSNDGTTSTVSYDDRNRTVTALDELGHKTVTVLDLLGQLNETREFYSASSYHSTKVTYNALGQTLIVRQSSNEVTRTYYDSLGRETSIAYPDSKSESYTYDEGGRLLTATSRSNSVTANSYDPSGNIVRVSGTDDTIRTTYNAEGLVTNRSNSIGYIVCQYNNRDLISSVTERIDSNSFTFGYHYNAVGDVDYVDYPDGKRITYSYDRYTRPTDMKIGNAPLLNVTYSQDDAIAVEKYGNSNSSMSYWYNSRGFVQEIKGKTYSNSVIVDLFYDYYADGNVWSIRDAVGSAGNEFYWYDQLGRITKAMANSTFGTIMFGYTTNGVGDRLWKNDAGTNRTCTYTTYSKITSDGTWTYTHDSNGNIVWKEISMNVRYNYTYDSFGRMTAVKKQVYAGGWQPLTTLASYYYDANGARAKTVEGAYTNKTVYLGHDPIYEVGSDGKGWKYLNLGSKLELRVVSPTEKQSYVCDVLGSVRMVLNNGDFNTPLFSARTYKPFGTPIVSSGTSKVTYAGEIRDTPSGLYYLSARYYDSELGRFYALDPELGSPARPQILNRYVYCVNSPLIHADPSGRFFNLIAAAIGAVVGAVIGGIATYVMSGGDLQATGAAMLGGMVAGGLAGLTMGTSLIASSAVLNGMVVGGISSAAGGALEGALSAGAKSNWNLGKMVESAAYGGIVGGVTGLVSGGAFAKILAKAVPKGVKPYDLLKATFTDRFASAKTASYATREGITDGVRTMSVNTAEVLGEVATVASLIGGSREIGIPVSQGMKAFVSYYGGMLNDMRYRGG
ncbi:MAG: hypothetical protein LUO79_06430 [Methanomassiliicoccales archaeon]|nr:hypothetical protein [Methanomassiliicoccales archaeon]